MDSKDQSKLIWWVDNAEGISAFDKQYIKIEFSYFKDGD